MANPQHIEWLLEGVEAWNKRREEDRFIPDFEEADIRGNFKHASKLDGNGRVDLRGAYLQDANLQGANLQHAYLQGAYLQGAYLQDAYLKART
jgi:uncharacterized protein YjbI with pentapeptide repeats